MYSIETRIRYSEVNSEKQLTLPALLDYFQDCCTFQSEDLKIGIDYLTGAERAWVLLSWQVKVLRYPQMGEKVTVSTFPYDFKGFYGYRNFLITGEDGEALAQANSVWVFMDTARMRPARISEKVAETYQSQIEPRLSGEWTARKLTIPEGGERSEPVTVPKFWIDTNHHMNNRNYILLAEEYLPEAFEVGELRAEYRKSAMAGDVIYPVVTVEEQQVWVALQDEKENNYAVVQFLRRKGEAF